MKVIEIVSNTPIEPGEAMPAEVVEEVRKKLLEQIDPTLSPEAKAEAIGHIEGYLESLKEEPALALWLREIEERLSQAQKRLSNAPGQLERLARVLDHTGSPGAGVMVFRLGGAQTAIIHALAGLAQAEKDIRRVRSLPCFPGNASEDEDETTEDEPLEKKTTGN